MGELTLNAGDVLLLPHGDSHILRSRITSTVRAAFTQYRNAICVRSTLDVEPDTKLLCGRLLFEAGGANPLVAALSSEIVIRTADAPLMARLRHLLMDIKDELDSARPGPETIAGDLARALFVMTLRDHLTIDASENGTLSLLRDKRTARVVMAVLGDLAREWTLEDMAKTAITSRATLVRAFRNHAHVAPMTFLSDLRLSIARQRLAGTDDSIANIASDVGYGAEGALSKAVMRKFGLRPGALRLNSSTSNWRRSLCFSRKFNCIIAIAQASAHHRSAVAHHRRRPRRAIPRATVLQKNSDSRRDAESGRWPGYRPRWCARQ